MAGVNYTRMAATAQRLVAGNGTRAVLRRNVAGVYDPITDTSSDGVIAYPISIVMAKLNQGTDDQDIELVREAFVQGKAIKAFLAADDLPDGVTPALADRIAVAASNEVWVVRGINAIHPADVALMYILVMERT